MVHILLADGFEEIEAISTIDILRRGGLEVVMVSISSEKTVTGAHHIKVTADKIIKDLDFADVNQALILPGGMPGATHLDESKEVNKLLTHAFTGKIIVAAICAAPLVLGKRGYLNGKRATCYPGFEDYLKGAILSTERVVRDGEIITSRGAGTAAYFAFELLDILKNETISEKVRSSMLYPV